MPRSLVTMSLASLATFIVTSAQAETVFAIAEIEGEQVLVKFDSASPGHASIVNPVSGLDPQEMILGLDQRPADTKLYAVTSSNRLFRIDRHSAEAQAVAAGSFATGLDGTAFGFDFNPQIDRIRNVSDADQNLVLNPNTGALQLVATPVFYAAGDVNAGNDPNVVHHAYNNNFFGTTSTQLYALDSANDMLVKQANNAGTLTSVGPLGVDFGDMGGFDISASGAAIGCSTVGCDFFGISRLFTIDLASGAATFAGVISTGAGDLLRITAMTIYSPAACRSDFDHTGQVDGADLGWLLVGWLTGDDQMDTTDDGVVDGADWGNVMADWGPCGD